MKLIVSPASFAIAYCCAYVAVFALDWPLFKYYPQVRQFVWGWNSLQSSGPAMAWYGLMVSAAALALAAAMLVPDRWLLPVLRNRMWLFMSGAMLACTYLLRQFFA